MSKLGIAGRLKVGFSVLKLGIAGRLIVGFSALCLILGTAVGEIVQKVSTASTELEAAASTLTSTAETTQHLSTTVAAARLKTEVDKFLESVRAA